ncbi:MAG: hypothetical protein A2571_02535 [Candidatus Vogelbacteria bacterium RIFOXYD1_FULL_44_32]|uniref:Baseplate protein J-like domain-containing protein n=1 Tax=Candidatus Vogelbacteria bacterium RIFOXYD1_FULL_44_32 TaxID=1802438 RepID=A0A1G2QF41_9BACT|nr:MAG: hypothetical protein A2571_02535 [Candidatus Vogelbacteria bacterium RIFOXYD1_FULL_44_32]
MSEELTNNHKKSLREILPKGNGRSYRRSIPFNPGTIGQEEEGVNNHIAGDAEAILRSRRMPKIPKYLIWGLGLAFIIIIVFVVSSVFAQATVYISPKQAKINLTETFTAYQSAAAGELEFGTITNSISEAVVVKASGTKDVAEKATGQITIFNDFSSEPQTLIAKTRFETSDGKIFRITKEVVVPGQKIETGKSTPGQVTTTVVADVAGAEYNVGPAEFTIPGFKDTPRYDKFSARSKTAMVGGLVGKTSTISETDRQDAEAELKQKLATKSGDKSAITVPSGQILFKDSLLTSTTFETKAGSKSGEAQVVGTLTYTGIVFNEEKLAGYLASRYIPDYDDEPVTIANEDALNLTIVDKDKIDPQALTEINIKAGGTAYLIWQVDIAGFKKALTGYNKGNFEMALADFPAIESAKLKLSPPWASSIPDDTEKITIEEVLQGETAK